MNTFTKLQKVISSFFKIEESSILANTSAKDISDWDSFTHMELMTKIEEHFNIQIPFTELMEFQNVGDIEKYIDQTKH